MTTPEYLFTFPSAVTDVFMDPKTVTLMPSEQVLLGFVANLAGGVTISSATATLYDLNVNTAITLTDAPTFIGSQIDQWIRGTELVANHGYRLEVSYLGSDGQGITGVLLINTYPAP